MISLVMIMSCSKEPGPIILDLFLDKVGKIVFDLKVVHHAERSPDDKSCQVSFTDIRWDDQVPEHIGEATGMVHYRVDLLDRGDHPVELLW